MSEIAEIIKSTEGVVSASILLREARPEDLKLNDQKLKMGYPYWLKSMHTGEFDQRTYFLCEETDTYELAIQLRHKMVYVAKNWREDHV